MDNLAGTDRKLTRWLGPFTTRSKTTEPLTGKQATALLLIGIGAIFVALLTVIWVFVVVIAPKLPASHESLAQSEGAAHLTAIALRNSLPGNDVRIERLFAYNLKLYVDRKPFEDMPNPDRKAMTEKIGRLWCDNIGHHWLARVGIFDIHSGTRLSTHACAFDKLRSALSPG